MHALIRLFVTVSAIPFLGCGPVDAAEVAVGRGAGGHPELTITGEIASADQCHAARLLVQRPDIRRVVVNSPGGDAWAGTRLARVIAWSGLPVAVPRGARAYSAAAVAVMGGSTRDLDGDIGFHAPHLVGRAIASGSAAASQGALLRRSLNARPLLAEVTAQTRAVLREGGMPERQIDRVMATGPTELWRPGKAALQGWTPSHTPDRRALERLTRTCESVIDSLR